MLLQNDGNPYKDDPLEYVRFDDFAELADRSLKLSGLAEDKSDPLPIGTDSDIA